MKGKVKHSWAVVCIKNPQGNCLWFKSGSFRLKFLDFKSSFFKFLSGNYIFTSSMYRYTAMYYSCKSRSYSFVVCKKIQTPEGEKFLPSKLKQVETWIFHRPWRILYSSPSVNFNQMSLNPEFWRFDKCWPDGWWTVVCQMQTLCEKFLISKPEQAAT